MRIHKIIIMSIISLRPASLNQPTMEFGSIVSYSDPHPNQAGLTMTFNDDASFRLGVLWDENKFLPLPFPASKMGITAVGVRVRGKLNVGTANDIYALLWDWGASAWVELGLYPFTASIGDATRWTDQSPLRFFDSSGRFKLRVANGLALGKPGAPVQDGQYGMVVDVLVDAERVVFSLPRQRLVPSISGTTGITVNPTGGAEGPADYSLFCHFDGYPFIATTGNNATDKKSGDLFDFPLAPVECDEAILEVLTRQPATSDAGVTECSISLDGGASFTPVFQQIGAVPAVTYRADRFLFQPPADRSLIRFRVRVENATTGGRSLESRGKVIVYYLLKKHKVVRLFPTANPTGQSSVASGSYTDLQRSDNSFLIMNSYFAGQSGGFNRYLHEIIFDPLSSPVVPSGELIKQIAVYLEALDPGTSDLFQTPVAIRNRQTNNWEIKPRGPVPNDKLVQRTEGGGGVPGWYFQLTTPSAYVGPQGEVGIKIFNDAGLNSAPTNPYQINLDFFYVEYVVPAPGETDWPLGTDVRGRIIASRLARYADPRPALLQKSFSLAPGGQNEIAIANGTGRFFLLADIYLWSSAKPGDVRLTVLRNGTPVSPLRSLRPQAVVDAPGFMGKLFSNVNILFAPGEAPSVRTENLSTGAADFILTLVGYSWGHINEMEGWAYDALEPTI